MRTAEENGLLIASSQSQSPSKVEPAWRKILATMQRTLGRSTLVVSAAVKIRNQCASIIRYQLGEDWHLDQNGESWLVQLFGPSCSTFVDVGANVGDWAQLLLDSTPIAKHGLLIDASCSAVTKLKERFQNEPGISIIHAAVSDTPGEEYFYEEEGAGMTSSLVAGFSMPGAKKTLVCVTTLDAEASKHGISYIDMLKIDAEGYDLHVLRGADNLLRNQSIGVIQFEYNAPWAEAGSTLTRARRLLARHGYEVFLLKSTGIYRIDFAYFGEFFEYANFIAVSKQKMPQIEAAIKKHPLGEKV